MKSHRILRHIAACLLATMAMTALAGNHDDHNACKSRNIYKFHPGNVEIKLHNAFGNADPRLTSGDILLHQLVRDGDADMTEKLLNAGIEPNPANDLGLTPLGIAAAMNHTKIVSLLLDAGADPNWVSKRKNYPCKTTPLHWAAYLGHTDVMTALLKAGADKNAAAENGTTPLDWANWAKHADAVLLLLTAGEASSSDKDSPKIEVPQ